MSAAVRAASAANADPVSQGSAADSGTDQAYVGILESATSARNDCLDGHVGIQQVGFKVPVEGFELIQRQHMPDVLVGSHDDHSTLGPIAATQLVDVLGRLQAGD